MKIRVYRVWMSATYRPAICESCHSELSEGWYYQLDCHGYHLDVCEKCCSSDEWGFHAENETEDYGFCPQPEMMPFHKYLTEQSLARSSLAQLLYAKLPRVRNSTDIRFTSNLQQLSLFEDGIPVVYVANVTSLILDQLKLDLNLIYQLSDEAFELFICDRLVAMGLRAERHTQNSRAGDGGIDIIAWSESSAFAGLIAVQAKHHRSANRKVPAGAARELEGVLLARRRFSMGVLVTNTQFAPGARWVANESAIMKLRDIGDIARWLKNDFSRETGVYLSDLPDTFELGNNIIIPKSMFRKLN